MDIEQLRQTVLSLDLSQVFARLVNIEGWKKREAEEAITQYRNYLFLRKKYPHNTLPPSRDIDEVWHAHILHTKEYRQFCASFFGGYLDHDPHLTEEGSLEKLQYSFTKTQDLYFQEFGSPIYQVTGHSLFGRVLERAKNKLFTKFPNLQKIVENV